MKYLTGETIKIGDIISIEHGKTIGIVYSIINTNSDMLEWGVNELGVIIKADPFGLVMWNNECTSDPLIFKKRKSE